MSAISGTIGALMGSKAQKDAANKAANASIATAKMQADLIRELFNLGRSDMLPFIEAGAKALEKLWDTDPTGGAEKYLQNLMGLTFPEGVDPTGGVQKYMDEIEGLEFEFDPNDEVYKWRQEENTRQMNQFMASRGGYDSRAAANILMSSGMNLQAQETERQFQQKYLAKYNKLRDLAGLSMQKGAMQYDAAKDKYAADVAKNITGFNAAMTQGGAQYNKLLDLIKVGSGAGATAGSYGMNASNQLANVYGQMSQDVQNSILQKGAASAQMWNNLGQQSNNALMTYLMMRGGGGS